MLELASLCFEATQNLTATFCRALGPFSRRILTPIARNVTRREATFIANRAIIHAAIHATIQSIVLCEHGRKQKSGTWSVTGW